MICAIVFAAGQSRRMGTAQKLLLPWANKTVIAQVVDEIVASPVEKIFVVVRPDNNIRRALAGRDVEFVVNPNSETEMIESLRCALRLLPPKCEAVLVALGDQPLISRELVGQMITAFHESKRGIVIPVCENRRGHPMLFSTRFRDEVLREFVGVGLKALRAKHPEEVFELPISSPVIFEDIDTPEDYERLRSHQFPTTSGT